MGSEASEKLVNHYSSKQKILLVGEGDFSFSCTLARLFGSGSNIVATPYDYYTDVLSKYGKAKRNLRVLTDFGSRTIHGVDATRMSTHPELLMEKFDRVVYNFPHAGFHRREDDVRVIERHRTLVGGFLANAWAMLQANGQVHISHKTTTPFSSWNLEELAKKNGLRLVECIEFKIQQYPGYHNKRGDGKRCNKPFPLGRSSTFMFEVSPAV